MDEILQDFKEESLALIESNLDLLEEIEEDPSRGKELEKFGQQIDRIMGGAKNVYMLNQNQSVKQVGDYSELCKIVGYKGSQVVKDKEFFAIIVAFLIDATEMMEDIVNRLGTSNETGVKEVATVTFLDRLKWINEKFKAGLRSSVETAADRKETDDLAKDVNPEQAKLDELMKSLGIG